MARGPLPSEKSRRRNAPTIPKTKLPASGRKGRPPKAPASYNLEKAGTAWWKWAWSLPQALAWDPGALYVLARRAQLEDDLVAVDDPDDLVGRIHDSVMRILESAEPADVPERLTYLGLLVAKLKSIAGGRATILKEMRELDKVLGLTPKAMAELRWEIVADEEAAAAPAKPAAAKKAAKRGGDRRRRLVAVK